MIVQPNFLDHWKTRLLQTELGDDPLAPTYILRLWGHCQEQKTHRFPRLSAGALAAICSFKNSAEQLWLAMQSSGFIIVKNSVVEVHEWDKYNAGLITSWSNGKKGGRPKKPTGNPQATHGKPEANPDVTDREDGMDKMESEAAGKPARKADPLFEALAWAEGSDPKQLTASGSKRVAVALADIRRVDPDVTVTEITNRAKSYRKLFRDAAISAHAISSNWAKLGGAANGPLVAGIPEPDDWKNYWRSTYPPEDCPDAPRYENGTWADVRRDHKIEIAKSINRRTA